VAVLPETRYARAADGAHIAYQVVGHGPPDLVFISGWFTHVDGRWELPAFARFLERLASFSRVLLFDQRGTGASDPLPSTEPEGLESWADDILTVMDAAGSQRAVLLGTIDGGPITMVFGATHPERVSGLVLADTTARALRAADYSIGIADEVADQVIASMEELWGVGDWWQFSPSTEDNSYRSWLARYQRMSGSPGRAAAMARMIAQLDVRHVLPTIQAPTLVLHRRDAPIITADQGRYLADRIPDARFVELSGDSLMLFFGDTEAALDEIEEFATGTRRGPDPDRFFATLLFTDIVESTMHAAQSGDYQWKQVLDQHEGVARRTVERFRGRLVSIHGDAVLAAFDGPGRAVRAACSMRDSIRDLAIDIRAGVHAGEIEMRGDDIAGIAVHLAQRVCSHAGPGEVLVSRTVVDLVAGSGIDFDDRGDHELKGVPGSWRLFTVTG
jgi:pimeloyl-ACP methyl ester carboxylesterase/class 3 adenylate cyclase